MPETGVPSEAQALRKRVEERAYALWESEGKPHGCDLDHWCRAEAEITAAGTVTCCTSSTAETASQAAPPEESRAVERMTP